MKKIKALFQRNYKKTHLSSLRKNQTRNYLYINSYHIEINNDDLRNHHEYVLQMVTKDGLALQSLEESFKDSEEIVQVAVQNNGLALQFASERLKKSFNIALIAIQKDKNAIKYASEEIQKDEEILELLKNHL